MYVGAQFVGGILGTVGIWIAYGSLAREVALLAATFPRRCRGPQGAFGGDPDRLYPGLRSDLGSHRREGPSGRGPLAVGFALARSVLSAGPMTGGSVNPREPWDRGARGRTFRRRLGLHSRPDSGPRARGPTLRQLHPRSRNT